MKRFVMDIPDEVHQRIKAACALEGKSMKQVAMKLLEEFAAKVEKKKTQKS
jgi:predicted HicB family RNase H-like nuclease